MQNDLWVIQFLENKLKVHSCACRHHDTCSAYEDLMNDDPKEAHFYRQ